MPTSITNLHIQGIPLERQVAYTQYSANISSFIHANATGKTITVSPGPLGKMNHFLSLPLTPPTVSFTLQKALNSDQSEKFITILGPGASKTQSGKTTIYHAPAIDPLVIESVVMLSTPFFNAGRDAVNPKGISAYKFLNNIVCVFLSVHTYPAFRDESSESITCFEQLHSDALGCQYYPKDTKHKDKDGKESVTSIDLGSHSYTINEFNKRGRDIDDMVDEDNDRTPKFPDARGFFKFRGSETVFKAVPNKNVVKNIGTSLELPKSTGHVFPYFRGLIQPDPVYMNSIVLRRFYQLLGSTHQECQSAYLDIRHGINSFSSTDRGMEFCHILLGIDLALDTQSRCFLIIDKGQYQGFSLIGARYAIFCNTKWHAPAGENEFSDAVARMDPHESAIDDMTKKLGDLLAKNQYTGRTERVIFSEPDLLVEALDGLKIADIEDDDIRELDRCIRSLNYMGTGYLTKNPQMISDMLETLSSNKSVVLTRPTFLPSVKAPMKSRVFALLSQFGPEAPSFWNDRGKEIICKPIEKSVVTSGGKRKIGDTDDFGNMPNKILITPKPLLVAVGDMDKIIEKGRVKMDVDERAGRYRNISVEHEDTRKRMWKGLLKVCAEPGKKSRVDDPKDSAGEVDLEALMFKLIGN